MDLIPTSLLDQLLAALPVDLHAPIREGLNQVQAPAMEVSLAAWRAEQEGVPFSEAVRNEGRFLALSRAHYSWLDLLQLELPSELAEDVRAALRRVGGLDFGQVRREIFAAAAQATGPTGSLMRFLLTEALYVNVVLAVRQDDGSLEASGCLAAAERDAQRVLQESLADARMHEAGIRPLETMFCDLMLRLQFKWNDAAPTIARATTAFRERFETLLEASRRAKLADAADAAIIRSVIDREFDGESVGSQRLADRHPLVFPSAEGVNQRRSRLRRKWLAGERPQAAEIRLIDILFEDPTEAGDVQQR